MVPSRAFGLFVFFACFAAACSSPSSASEPQGAVTPAAAEEEPAGQAFGAALSPREPVALSSILAHPERYEGQIVRTSGPVQAVCAQRGCWMDIGGQDEAEGRVHVRSLNHALAFPRDAVGKIAEVEGEVQALPGASACGSAAEEEGVPGCGVAANGRRAQLAVRGAVLR